MSPLFVLYVRDQTAAASFYRTVLDRAPILDVSGMTEFDLGGSRLGLMPEAGIARLLAIDVSSSTRRAELYLPVDDPAAFHRRALAAGATELSPLTQRDWGDDDAYSQDLDGHVLAFARRST
ncbi:MAG: glyoxalase [Proteobacteria bacterium]|nr:glyoxalase [Pseudomonadota bacterium]MCP4922250.1 glyoxalase [Pseudomonadota bacterium]